MKYDEKAARIRAMNELTAVERAQLRTLTPRDLPHRYYRHFTSALARLITDQRLSPTDVEILVKRGGDAVRSLMAIRSRLAAPPTPTPASESQRPADG